MEVLAGAPGVDVNARDSSHGLTPLFMAVRSSAGVVRQLLAGEHVSAGTLTAGDPAHVPYALTACLAISLLQLAPTRALATIGAKHPSIS